MKIVTPTSQTLGTLDVVVRIVLKRYVFVKKYEAVDDCYKRRKSRLSIYIETERLILRQFTVNDVEELQYICSQPYILKWMPDWKRTIEERKQWISWVQKKYLEATKDVARIMLAVTNKSSKQLIGMVGIGNKEEVNNEIEIAYFISEDYSYNGYISEATKAMMEWVFTNLKLDYLIAIVEPDNIPSQRVIEKCGFTKLDTKMIFNSGDTEEKPFYYYRIYKFETSIDYLVNRTDVKKPYPRKK